MKVIITIGDNKNMRYSLFFEKRFFKKILTLFTIILFIGTSLLPTINGSVNELKDINYDEKQKNQNNDSVLDIPYIYSLTENLSNIIFTEYNESNGELAKGRWFGTNGENKAAEILYENMTKLGLYTKIEQIKNIKSIVRPNLAELTYDIQINDFGLKVNDKPIKDFYISTTSKGPKENPNQLDYNFSFEGLKVIKKPKIVIPFIYWKILSKNKKGFVFIEQETAFNPDLWPPLKKFLSIFIDPIRKPMMFGRRIINDYKKTIWYYTIPDLKGIIKYDFNKDAYNMGTLKSSIPVIYVNKTIGNEILSNIDNVTVDFYLNQTQNYSVISYNVIGQLNGTDPTKTVIVDCLYDSWWCQGTADAAIGMAMVLGVAKYFTDNNITPGYNIKFIGFCGEEAGVRGAKYYEAAHKDENIIYVIDLNQVGFKQDGGRLTLNIICNKLLFLKEVWGIVVKTDYAARVNNTADITPLWMPTGAPSDDQMFAMFRPSCKTVCFLKDTGWLLHHRDGLNHTEGDVLKYFDWNDVEVTGEIVLNVTKYLTVEKIEYNKILDLV